MIGNRLEGGRSKIVKHWFSIYDVTIAQKQPTICGKYQIKNNARSEKDFTEDGQWKVKQSGYKPIVTNVQTTSQTGQMTVDYYTMTQKKSKFCWTGKKFCWHYKMAAAILEGRLVMEPSCNPNKNAMSDELKKL